MVTSEFILGINENDLKEVRAIRHTVFNVEQKIPEEIENDGYDSSAVHVLTYMNGIPAATGRLLILNDEFTIGRIAVLKEYRKNRLGDLVVRLLIRAAFDMGGERQIVHAQLPVQGFYEKLGFTPKGEVYDEAGIPHITMTREGDIFGKCKEV